jgi:hypothetical protein
MLYITKQHIGQGPDYVVGMIRAAIGGQLPGFEG